MNIDNNMSINEEDNNVKNSFNYKSLQDYIDNHMSEKGSKNETHQLVKDDGYRTNFIVSDENYVKFIKLYVKEKEIKENKMNIMEKSRDIGPLYFDFDFKTNDKKRLFDTKDIQNVVYNMNEIIRKYLNVKVKSYNDDDTSDSDNENEKYLIEDDLISFILYKNKPIYNKSKEKYCDGIHIHYPNLILTSENRLLIYDKIESRLEDMEFIDRIFEKTNENMKEVFDKSVMFKDKWWFLYKSGKKVNDKFNVYKLKFKIYSDGYTKEEVDINDKKIIKKLRIRNIYNDTDIITFKLKYLEIMNSKKTFFVENNNKKDNNLQININIENKNKVGNKSTNEESAIKLCSMLSKERATNYGSWRDVGYALFNISSNLNKNFHKFSALCGEKYDENSVDRFWDGCTIKNDSNYLYGLEQWAKKDNLTKYNEYLTNKLNESFNKNIDTKADYDLASVVYDIYKNDYSCSGVEGGQIWWEFIDHRWVQTENGASLNVKLSEEFAYHLSQVSKLYSDKLNSTNNDDKQTLVDVEKKGKEFFSLIRKFKTQSFKKKILAEAGNIFFIKNTVKRKRKKFIELLDSKCNLIGFENGVYDLDTMTFRSGKPDDYITFSTGYDYTEYKNNKTADFKKKEKLLDEFFHSIQPETDANEFLKLYLASILYGRNKDQLALVWSGSGANGKGTLTKLMKNVLGDYYSTTDPTLITRQRRHAGEASPHLADKKGRRWLEVCEPDPDDKVETGILKTLTGEDIIQARPLYEKPFYYIPQFSFTLQCNDKPKLKSDDGGVRRRIRVLTFPNKFIDNPKKSNEQKLVNDIDDKLSECKDVLMWLLINVYYVKYKEWGILKGHEPKTMLEDSAEYIDKSNTIKIFFNTKYSVTDNKNDKLYIEDIWDDYQEWHKNNYPSIKNIDQPKLVEYIKNNGFELNSSSTKIYKISKKDNTEADED